MMLIVRQLMAKLGSNEDERGRFKDIFHNLNMKGAAIC
jgi:hypothetical protein